MRGNGSSVGESSGAAKGGSNVNSAGEVLVSMLCWNVAGWAKGGQGGKDRSVESNYFRAKVINFFQPDVACLVETWLKDRTMRRWTMMDIAGLGTTDRA